MVFDFLRRGAQTEAPEAKASATGPVVAYHSAGRVAWSPRDTVSLTRTGFSGNPVGFRSVKLIAEAAAALPLVLQDRQQRYDVHPVLSLVRQPNAAQGRAELMEALFGQLLLSGNAYVEAVSGEDGVPLELHVLRSDRMKVVPGGDGWPVAYEYSVGSRKHRFDTTGPVSPICHVKSFHPQDDHYGFSPMQAAAMAVDVHNSASRWSKALLDNAFVWAWDARPFPTFPNNGAQWSDGENFARGHWINGRVGSRSLASVVEEICRRSGLTAIDTSQLFGIVRGYVVDQVADARTALQPLMLRYGFDAVERDGVLQFLPRTGARATEIEHHKLVDSGDVEGLLEQNRDAEAELTGRVRVRFVQSGGDYDVVAEEAVLADTATHAVASDDLMLAMTRAEGRQVAERWLTEARVSRDTARFALAPSQMSLGAGDVVRLPTPEGSGDALYRIDRVEQSDMQIVDAVRIERAVYSPSEMADGVPKASTFVPPVPVTPLFLDLPMMTGDEIPHAPHLAVSAQPWPGSVAVYASGSDENYELSDLIVRSSVVGLTESALSRASPGLWDFGDGLQVKLLSGALETRSAEAVLNGANLAAIGDGTSGNWELFQFEAAELVDTDTYRLSRRLRGQLGTDGIMPDNWPTGSWFVLMNGAPVQTALTNAQKRIARHYRVGPAQRGYDDPSYTHLVEAFDGNGLRPYSPCHLRTSRSEAGDLSLDWVRRTRIDGDSWDLPEVPLGEVSETYVVRVWGGAALFREVSVSDRHWTYGAGLQAADGVAAPLRVEVAQVSDRYGAGPFTSIMVPD